jgi:flagellar motor protein MotB
MRRHVMSGGFLGLLILVAAVGCDGSKDMQIAELQREVDELSQRNDDLESQLAMAIRDGEDARRRALQLQQMLDDAQRQIAELGSQPGLPPGWEGTQTVAWIDVGTDILFDSGKASLKKDAQATLGSIVETIQSEFPDREVWVIGHTDTDPIKITKHLWKDNLDLSLNRAATVARELYKLGIEEQRVVAAGQGEFNPKAPNDTKANKEINRRVQIVAVSRPQEAMATGG